MCYTSCLTFFFFNDTATTEIYTLSLHDALPIFSCSSRQFLGSYSRACGFWRRTSLKKPKKARRRALSVDRKSTRLNSSHSQISYAVFCLKKKKRRHGIVTVSQKATTLLPVIQVY